MGNDTSIQGTPANVTPPKFDGSTLVKRLTGLLAKDNVSDIHLSSDEPIRMRVDGALKPLDEKLIVVDELRAFAHILAGYSIEDHKDFSKRGDKDFPANLGAWRLRCNYFKKGAGGRGLAIRRLEQTVPNFDDLNLPESLLLMADKAKGLLLVTGPTGSGKSTTLSAVIDYINATRYGHIITMEDPIEYKFVSKKCLIDQRQIGNDASDFHAALRSALRQDPDVIVVGEMRDKETAQMALDAAETGHLVLATLHTVSARQTIERVTGLFSGSEREWAQQTLASVLNGVMSQVLVERKEGGRVLCYELMVNTSAVKQAIRDNRIPTISNIMETGTKDNQILMNKNLIALVRNGDVSLEDALYYSYDSISLQNELKDVTY